VFSGHPPSASVVVFIVELRPVFSGHPPSASVVVFIVAAVFVSCSCRSRGVHHRCRLEPQHIHRPAISSMLHVSKRSHVRFCVKFIQCSWCRRSSSVNWITATQHYSKSTTSVRYERRCQNDLFDVTLQSYLTVSTSASLAEDGTNWVQVSRPSLEMLTQNWFISSCHPISLHCPRR